MYVGVQHRINDGETAFARGEALLKGEGAPSGVRVREFYPSQDRSAATCLWEADSLDAVRQYVESTLGDSSENTYFEIDAQNALGLPETASASV